MNLFLKNLFHFVAVLALFLGTNFVLNKIIISYNQVTLKSNLVIMGDSHVMTSIDPQFHENSMNIAQTAEPYLVTYLKLKEIAANGDIDTLLLGFSYHNISSFNDLKFSDPFWADELFDRTHSFLNPLDFPEVQFNYSSYTRSIVKNMLLFPNNNHASYIGHFRQRKTVLDTVNHRVDATIDRHYQTQQQSNRVSKISIHYLDSIVNFCERHKIQTVLINTPLHSTYRKHIPKEVVDEYDAITARMRVKTIPVLDYSQFRLPDGFFADYDHLNEKGANFFSKKLFTHLRKSALPADLSL